MEIRLAHPNELTRIIEVIDEARSFLAATGSDQWQGAYPDRETIFDDILTGKGYVGVVGGQVVLYAAVFRGKEAEYDAIYDGKWQHNHPIYTTIHRVAVAEECRGQGLVKTFLQGIIEGQKGPDFRCDTHEKNVAMQHLLLQLGFVYCGKVLLAEGERLAYQKIKGKGERSLYQEIAEDDRWLLGRE